MEQGGYATRFGAQKNPWIEFRRKHANQGYTLEQLQKMYYAKEAKSRHCDHRVLKKDRWQCDSLVKGRKPKNTTKPNKFVQAVKREALASNRLFPEVLNDPVFIAKYKHGKLDKKNRNASRTKKLSQQQKAVEKQFGYDIRKLSAPNLDVESVNQLVELPPPPVGAPKIHIKRPLPFTPKSGRSSYAYDNKIDEALKQISRLSDDDIRLEEAKHREQLNQFDELMNRKEYSMGEREQVLKTKADFLIDPYVIAVKERFDELKPAKVKKFKTKFDFNRLSAPNLDVESENLLFDRVGKKLLGPNTEEALEEIRRTTKIVPAAILYLTKHFIQPVKDMDSRSGLILMLSEVTDYQPRELEAMSDEEIIDLRETFVDHQSAKILKKAAKQVAKTSYSITVNVIKSILKYDPVVEHIRLADLI